MGICWKVAFDFFGLFQLLRFYEGGLGGFNRAVNIWRRLLDAFRNIRFLGLCGKDEFPGAKIS